IIQSLPISLPATPAERVSTIQRLIAERRLALQQMDAMRVRLKELEAEVNFFSSQSVREQIESASLARERAALEKKNADERLALAVKANLAAKEEDERASHLSAILEHGERIGLQEGHCPLCDAVRTDREFADAIAAAKARLARRGETLARLSAEAASARSEAEMAGRTLADADREYSE